MDRNLGATSNDASTAAAKGDLYQWGRGADGHQSVISTNESGAMLRSATVAPSISTIPTYSEYVASPETYAGKFIISGSGKRNWISDTDHDNSVLNLWQESGVQNPCPDGYRIPTKDEWEAIIGFPSDNATPDKLTTVKADLSGDIIIAKYTKTGETQNTALPNIILRRIDDDKLWILETTVNGVTIKFPSNGRRWETGLYVYPNLGTYWTSTVSPDDGTYHSAYALNFNFNASIEVAPKYYRASSASIRCVKVEAL